MEGAQQLQNLYVVEEEAAAVIIFLVRKLLVVGKDGEEMTKIASCCMKMPSWYFYLKEGLFGLSRTMLRLMGIWHDSWLFLVVTKLRYFLAKENLLCFVTCDWSLWWHGWSERGTISCAFIRWYLLFSKIFIYFF